MEEAVFCGTVVLDSANGKDEGVYNCKELEKFSKPKPDITSVFNKHVKELLSIPNVTGVDINYRYINELKQPYFEVLVKKKEIAIKMSPEEWLPKEICNWPVEILEDEAYFI